MNKLMTSKLNAYLGAAALIGIFLSKFSIAQQLEVPSVKQVSGIEKEQNSFNNYEAITKALEPYITAAKTGNGKLSRSAFFDHAHIVGSIDGTFYNPSADEFGKIISDGGPSPDVKHRIAWIDVSGPAAAAKVEFINWNGFRFTDFFVLYKKDGQWKISGKVYDSHTRN